MNVQSAVLAQFKDVVLPRKAANEPGHAPVAAPVRDEAAAMEPIVSAAVLVTTAFRMRDEASLISTLRLLTDAVAAYEAEQDEAAGPADWAADRSA